MRRVLSGCCLLALTGCAQQAPDRMYPVFFTPFSTQLDESASRIVDNAAGVSKRFPKAAVEVIGYADPAGAPADNVKLSQARADVVTAALIKDGVPGSLVVTKAGGTPPGSQQGVTDRRAEIDIDLP